MHIKSLLAAGVLASGVSASQNYLGFNSGSTLADHTPKVKSDFLAEFNTAQKLKSSPGVFNSVRLYTNIQAGSESDPISAFEAAIDTKTYILLGIWTSGTDSIDNELTALKKAVSTYGKKFTDLVIGISIGSEDLYRVSVTGIKNKAGVGNSPQAIVNFINEFKKSMSGNPLSKIPVGHVDTWDVWGNSTNKPVLDAIDWIGVDEYPYYETGKGNDIGHASALFERAYKATIAASDGKPVWVTETGWPVTGPDWDKAHPSVQNAKTYWQQVGCKYLFNKTPTFWYNLRDSNPDNKMKFAITDNLSTTPYFDLSCPKHLSDHSDNSGKDKSSDSTSTSSSGDHSSTTMSKPSESTTTSDSGSASTTSSSGASTTSSSSSGSGSGSGGSGSGGSGSGGSGSSGSGSGSSGSSTTSSAVASKTADSAAAFLEISSFATFVSVALFATVFALY